MSQYYQTSDLGLAAYLLYHGMTLLGSVATSNPNRHAICFTDTESRKQLVTDYEEGIGQVNARTYSKCSHRVARALKQPVVPS